MIERTYHSALTPGALNGKAPKSYGKGRRCACGTKIMEYRKGTQCGLCEIDPERAKRVLAQKKQEEQAMFGIDKWKSKDYPEGCADCPEGEKFRRRHAGRGFCSLHYQRRKKEGTLDQPAAEKDDLGELADRIAAGQVNGHGHDPRLDGRLERQGGYAGEMPPVTNFDELAEREKGIADEPEHPGTVRIRKVVDTGVDVPATEGEIEAGKATRTLDEADVEPLKCCGAKDDPTEDCGGPDCEHRDRFEEPDATEPEEPLDDRLMRAHSEALGDHFDVLQQIELTLARYNGLVAASARTARSVMRSADELAAIGIDVKLAPTALQMAHEPDAEVEAMEHLRMALEGLDRDAQVRAVKWVTARLGIDRPVPSAAVRAGVTPSDAAATISRE